MTREQTRAANEAYLLWFGRADDGERQSPYAAFLAGCESLAHELAVVTRERDSEAHSREGIWKIRVGAQSRVAALEDALHKIIEIVDGTKPIMLKIATVGCIARESLRVPAPEAQREPET